MQKVQVYGDTRKFLVNFQELKGLMQLTESGKGEKGDTGEQGPQGERGLEGPQGVQGEQGIQGLQGVKGDTGNGFSLTKVYPSVADMEADYNNSEVPENAFVLINSQDTDNGKLFVKTDSSYQFQAQLAGVKGDKGDTGDQGIQGVQGVKGDRGLQGATGLQGVKGDNGSQGEQGIQGVAGLKGDKGDVGLTGAQGVQGPQGIQGERGIQGTAGIQGVAGLKGDKGEGISIGHTYKSKATMVADLNKLPDNSLIFINSGTGNPNNGEFYSKTGGELILNGVLEGIQGPQGDTGLQGIQGPKGDTGAQGLQGAQGLTGVQGIAGAQGIRGAKGDKGDTGEIGPRGVQGEQGLQGVQGPKGDKGDDGTGISVESGVVTVSSALSSRSGSISNVVLQKQGILTKLSMQFYNGSTTQQAAGTRLTIGTLPVGFRPLRAVHTFASDNGGSNYPRHALIIESNGNIIWIPQNATGYFTMSFSIVF